MNEAQRPKDCNECGACTQDCIIVRYGGETIATILSGDSDSGSWNCSNCWKCIESCPLDVDILDFLFKRRKSEGVPIGYKGGIELAKENGFFLDLKVGNDLREQLGLPRLRFLDKKEIEVLLGEDE